jgi:hypothetical protein
MGFTIAIPGICRYNTYMTTNKENDMNSELLAIAIIVKSENIVSGFVRDLRIVQLLKAGGTDWRLLDEVNEIMENL